jgi:hypothetical protein
VDERSDFKRVIVQTDGNSEKKNQNWSVRCFPIVSTVPGYEGEKLKLHMLIETEVGSDRAKLPKVQRNRVMYGFASWENKDKDKKLADYHLSFRMEGELLVVDTYAIYAGDFSPLHWRCEYKKEK